MSAIPGGPAVAQSSDPHGVVSSARELPVEPRGAQHRALAQLL
jgi:hypothetical protein